MIIHTSSAQTQSNIKIAINSPKCLYMGFRNPVEISVGGYKSSELTFTCSNGEVESKDQLYIIPHKLGPVCVKVYSQGTHISTIDYIATDLPYPIAHIAGKTRGKITQAELLSEGKISLRRDENRTDGQARYFPYDSLINIYTYVVSLDGHMKFYNSDDEGKFPPQLMQAISNARNGQVIFFDNIEATTELGSVYKFNRMMFTIIRDEKY